MDSDTEDLRPQVLQDTLQQISSSEAAECCVICLDSLTEQCEAHPCKHNNFDYVCLITWLLHERTRCPLCKSDVREVRYDLSADGKQGKVYKLPERSEGPEKPLSRRNNNYYNNGYYRHWNRLIRQSENEAIQKRHFVYRHNLYSLHVGSNRRQPAELRYRELSPQLFRNDPELVSRARTWISRELQVFEFIYTGGDPRQRDDDGSVDRRRKPSKAEYLLEYIIAILKVLDIQCSTGQAEDLIQEFLGRRYTRLFLHELKAWLRSPFKWLSAWDRAVQYNTPRLVSPNVGLQTEATAPRHLERRNRPPAVSRYEPYTRRRPAAK